MDSPTASTSLKPLSSYFGRDSAYWGEKGDWLVVLAHTRDSDLMAESNWRTVLAYLGGERGDVAIERASHWGPGWVEYMLVNPFNVELVEKAEAVRAQLDDYPVFDEEDWSRSEMEEYDRQWEDWGAGDFVRELEKKLDLTDEERERLEGMDKEELREFFESLIGSGEYYVEDGDPNIRSAMNSANEAALRGWWTRRDEQASDVVTGQKFLDLGER
jgi:hypothetical protein